MRQQDPEFETTSNTASSASTEARLIELAKQGEEYAIVELYRRNVDVIYRYIRARVCDDLVAEDLTAQVFLKVLEGLPGYQVLDRPFRAWLYRIAYARTVDYYRRQNRRQEVGLPETLPARGPQPGDELEAEAEWATAINLVAQLTEDQQDVIVLRFIGEMSLAEIAETLGKTPGAVKSLQHRALATLSRLLEEEEVL
ncbi:MAG: sigma-70 family RNA polymerase sigma factor [Anaerolineae bacterium]|nr:sigma-70 family RNA polymerase sigma factor [Anaerolineae bacterium]